MDVASRFGPELGIARLLLEAISFSLLGILLLIGFIVLRRWYRGRYFRRLNEHTFQIRSQWEGVVNGRVPARSWRLNRLDCEIVESILLDTIEVATPEQLPPLLNCLRSSGLLDLRIHQARTTLGWKRRAALVALGRTRAPEAIPALAEALEAPSEETRIAAVRGLGRTGLLEAATPILDHLLESPLHIPEHAVKNALASCCQNFPTILLRYLSDARGPNRELLARVLGELATADLGEDLIVLATDAAPEVRASAARALGNAQPSFALPVLSVLIRDKEWFVRLRAVVALASIDHSTRIRPLLHALCDTNRYVRQRAAWALTSVGTNLDHILAQVVETQDNYALQAFISELERSGAIAEVVDALEQHCEDSAGRILLQALSAGQQNMELASKSSTAAIAGVT
ncbi:MAG TPA: HEAT repeat domain-containing protein [Terriglobales bacterium]|nr:HEAT repeat domain-containing protein [Terriglobales bacterium]